MSKYESKNDRAAWDDLQKLWDETEVAPDYAPVPTGNYDVRLVNMQRNVSRQGTPCVNMEFRILEGEYAGRSLRHTLYLTKNALPYTKRDLAKFGVTSMAQVDGPTPKGLRFRVWVSRRNSDDGRSFNKMTAFQFLGIIATDEDDKKAGSDEWGAIEASNEGDLHDNVDSEGDMDDPLFMESREEEESL
jgi:hypothetical protein